MWRWVMTGGALAAIVVPAAAPAVVRALAQPPGPTPIVHSGKSGLWGTVSFGGPCGSGRPIKATQRIRSFRAGRVGPVVTEFSSEPNGTFEVELRAGRYLVEQAPFRRHQANAPGFLSPVDVIVPKGRYVRVGIGYDNGMRLPC